MTPPVHVVCACCKGTGRTLLTGEYARTLEQVRRLGREVSGAEIGRTMGKSGEAACVCLAALEAKGLLVSRRDGRLRLYRLPDAVTRGGRKQ